ncbi:aldo/keto reductase [Paenibacillus agricola]|uniref:Aldo/keto reductase n=1 Tax=Paenibacillus agricola TaxID=2716264 RepID=A0ABX0JM71_9BACL|nr:aldo/keto reductase [Paenibacillus agricola]NHN35220.1 aldo/keto reductase [Paenibacillus agricola]
MTFPQRKLGSTGLSVSAIGMGCMPISVNGRPSEEEGIRTIHAALEQGITFFDTADAYCLNNDDFGHNERILAKALQQHPEAIVATKGGNQRPDGRWEANGHPEHLRKAIEDSLRALNLETIVLYQLHRPDPNVPFAESVGAIADLQKEGKLLHAGLSNVSVEQLDEASDILQVASVQNRMNLFDHSSNAVLKRCEQLGIAFLPYSPLNGMSKAGQIGANEVLSRIADKYQASPQQIALAWLLHLSPVMIPIPGASKSSSITNSAKGATVALTPEDIEELSTIGS